ncbi:substrate-binding periplasmic protein [Rhizobium sp. C1]|uniref:substrate-binding periplasmic protein n=1 Tax=Rhizobium sp. C1 TaxID=1349799 RepID=UPI001E3E8757|nr:transporter substrate-binding domain-containing protein [Rhizobium sp. C1]MCD2176361.1 transporter substrate-binding domain-containing protein [Rhizobium sp. C1]
MRKTATFGRWMWAATFGLWSAAALPASGESLHLLTEDYPPYNYEEDGVLKGIAVDLVKAVMADAGLQYEMTLQPWARAYSLALNTPGSCVFSTVHTKERADLFEWVEPLFTTEAYLVRKSGSGIRPANLEEAKRYLIGTQLGDYTENLLKQNGFTRIDLTSEIDLSVKKLLAGRIDLMPMAASMLADLQRQGLPVEAAVILNTSLDALACNRQTDADALRRMRSSLKKLIADGTRSGIFQRYNFVEGGLLR